MQLQEAFFPFLNCIEQRTRHKSLTYRNPCNQQQKLSTVSQHTNLLQTTEEKGNSSVIPKQKVDKIKPRETETFEPASHDDDSDQSQDDDIELIEKPHDPKKNTERSSQKRKTSHNQSVQTDDKDQEDFQNLERAKRQTKKKPNTSIFPTTTKTRKHQR